MSDAGPGGGHGSDSDRAAAVLFDLDGTLIDSIPLILRSLVHTLREHGKPSLSEAELVAGVGTPLSAQFAPFAAGTDEVEAMVATYRVYNRHWHDSLVSAFPGAVDALRALALSGAQVGVVTSKARDMARHGLEHAGFDTELAVLIGSDDVLRHKPHPEPVLVALERLGVEPARATYVGDSPHDLVAGRAAGTRTAAVSWGPFPRAVLDACEPDVWLASPADIAAL